MKELILKLRQDLDKVDISIDERDMLLSTIYSLEKELHKNDFKLQSLLKQNKSTKNILHNIIKEIDEKNIEIQNYANTLEEVNNTKDRFFSIIAHDLRNPFNSLIGLSDLIKIAIKDEEFEETEAYNNIIFEVATRTYQLLVNLLAWARSQTNEIKFTPVKVEINKLIKNNIELVKAQLENKGLSLDFIYNEELFLYADSDMTDVIVRNLISNAVKYTKKGGVVISLVRTDKKCIIKVKDTGIGIRKKITDSIFNINDNAPTIGTSGEEGTGLGLIICKEFTIKNKGNITVESKIGKGSVFTLILPIYQQ